MKHINNSTNFMIILSSEEIEKLMACCNSASIRWNELAEKHTDKTWKLMSEIADELWVELNHIKNPKREF